MSCAFTTAEIDAIIADLKTQLTANATALAKAESSQQHSMDTGQTRVNVMHQQIAQLQGRRKSILSELDYWCNMKEGNGAHTARPGW